MKPFSIGVIIIILAAIGYFFLLPAGERNTPEPEVSAQEEYFADRLVTLGIEDIGQPIEGFDANLLIIAFPGLTAEDFEGVETVEGVYSTENGTIIFERNKENPITSAERMVSDKGYATLLENVSKRLAIQVVGNTEVDAIITLINTGEHVEAKIDQEVTALGVTIKPIEVLEDSRCPSTVQCVWAGTVRLRVELTSGLGDASQIFELGKPVTTEAEEITLSEVLPEAIGGSELEESEYTFIFEIKKR